MQQQLWQPADKPAKAAAGYAGIDYFRVVAAVFIIAIHTAPLKSFGDLPDYLITYCLGRIGVPFFFMVTGFFLSDIFFEKNRRSNNRLVRYGIRIAGVYLLAVLLYLPVNVYSGQIQMIISAFFKNILFDGTFYHLWYFPALLMGCMILYLLSRFAKPRLITVIVLLGYLVGLGGDSYYGLVSEVTWLRNGYDFLFSISSYTRNGVFFAPVFLWMGACIAHYRPVPDRKQTGLGLLIGLILLMIEGTLTYIAGWQRHNSMYLFLLPCMFFLFLCLLYNRKASRRRLRDITAWIYLLHPICIILVRAFARFFQMEELLINQSLVHFLMVCLFSFYFAVLAANMTRLVKDYVNQKKEEREASGK